MREIIRAIYDTLKADPSLSYVANWTIGGVDKTQLLYPFVNIGTIDADLEETTIGRYGSGYLNANVSIIAGTKSMSPELAYYGSETVSPIIKGLLHLCDDLRAVCRSNTFGCVFTIPAMIESIRTGYHTTPGEFVWLAEIVIRGRVKETRTQ